MQERPVRELLGWTTRFDRPVSTPSGLLNTSHSRKTWTIPGMQDGICWRPWPA
jgi:hypothetical protein